MFGQEKLFMAVFTDRQSLGLQQLVDELQAELEKRGFFGTCD